VEFVAGCDDATASSRRGYLYLQFSRTAPDLLTAVVSALSNVSKAGIGGRVMREEMKDAAETIHQVNLVLETIHSKPRFNKIAPMVHEAVRYSQHGGGSFIAFAFGLIAAGSFRGDGRGAARKDVSHAGTRERR